MAWAVGQDVGNPLRKLVLMVLADEHRDDTDLCCPGLERIAAIGEMSTKSAARHIDALAELGKITVYKRGRSHGYILHCPPKADAVSNEAPEPALGHSSSRPGQGLPPELASETGHRVRESTVFAPQRHRTLCPGLRTLCPRHRTLCPRHRTLCPPNRKEPFLTGRVRWPRKIGQVVNV